MALFAAAFVSLVLAASPGKAQTPRPGRIANDANWLPPDVNVWSFQNVTSLAPSAVAARGSGPSAAACAENSDSRVSVPSAST